MHVELVAERYALTRVLATGGMGVVWLARHVVLDQPVAIKFLRSELAANGALVARFLEEARAAAALRGEHVVRVTDVGQLPDGVPYFVMEYLEGTDLETLVQRDGPLDPDRAIDYVLQACEGLAEAHSVDIVHRDVKPENLFLVQGPSQKAVLKVVDFGIAKRLDASRAKVVTGPQENMGSPCYMSPEQMASPQDIDARTDIWSLGVVLYQLLTGELPFDGDSVVEVFARVAGAPARHLFEVRPELDVHLDSIVRRCLQKDPGARFQSVTALADALRTYRAAALCQTRPVFAPAPYVPQPVVRRSDVPVTLSRSPKERRSHRAVGLAAFAVWMAILGGAVAYGKPPAQVGRLRRFAEGWLTEPVVANVRHFTDGWLTEPALLADSSPVLGGAAVPEAHVVEPFGVISSDPAPYLLAEREQGVEGEDGAEDEDIDGEPSPSAEMPANSTPREHVNPAPGPAPAASVAAPTTPPLPAETEATREARQRAYQAYLARHGWRPLRDVLEEMHSQGAEPAQQKAHPPGVSAPNP